MRILVTDDLYTNRFQLGIILRNMGFAFDEACNGDQAIEMIGKQGYDLVFMDIEMPVRNGIETIQYIRENLGKKNLQVVAITAHDISENDEVFIRYGFNGLICKPVTEGKIRDITKKFGLKV